ncbi:MAG: PadR family transcriptional regulator [Marmoricola sp.]
MGRRQMWEQLRDNPELVDELQAAWRQRHHHHGGHHGRAGQSFGGPPPWVGAFFGPGGRGPGGRGAGGRGPRVRRGDVRFAILDVLGGGQLNGYQVIQQIAERTDGAWRPSPGSVYPTISQLQDEGLVEEVAGAERKLLRLTDSGSTYVAEHTEELAAVWEPFDHPDDDGDPANLRQVIGQSMAAVWQVAATGTHEQQRRAAEILADTRRRLYGVLADGPDDADEEA